MIISVAIVTGFQKEITDKVTGFDSHLKVVRLTDGTDQLSKLVIDHSLLEKLKGTPGISQVQVFAQQPGILEFDNEIQGVMIKGLDSSYRKEFFEKHLVEGKLPVFNSEASSEILLSQRLAKKLKFKTGDKIRVYFVNRNKPVSPRNYKVSGLFNTGLETFDDKIVFVSLSQLQRVKNYGLQAGVSGETGASGLTTVRAAAFGGDKNYTYSWSVADWKGPGPHGVPAGYDNKKPIRLVLKDGSKTLADTAFLNVSSLSNWSSGGSHRFYADGYEVFIDDINQLESLEEVVYEKVGYNLTTINLKNENQEIFNWLEILDVNVYIIIILLAVVAVINMCSALLILILERANMVGILKALGAGNFSIRKIFLYNGVLLISKGLMWGNAIALFLLLLQKYTGVITLPEAQYYIKEVPVNFNIIHILLLNLATIVVSFMVLLLPSMLITRLNPVKTIRFE